MSTISFADVVHQSITFHENEPAHRLVLQLIDTPWVQRLRDLSQTSAARLVYMFAEHSRFGHSLGVAYGACNLLSKLRRSQEAWIRDYELAIAAAALLHDVGHLAPGSHSAQRAWFPERPDEHEQISVRIIENDPFITNILEETSSGTTDLVKRILLEDPTLPPWTWQIISGSGWNVDRGNWCVVDSHLAGVSYGKYNIPALTESIQITKDGYLGIRENRLDAMMHFAVSRHAMYRQLYQHRVLLSADTLILSVVKRLRDLEGRVSFVDEAMEEVLAARSQSELPLDIIFEMREPWWRYHLMRWSREGDRILADLSHRLLERNLFKTVRIQDGEDPEELRQKAARAVNQAGFDPEYYLHEISTSAVHESELRKSMVVVKEDGRMIPLRESDPLFQTLMEESQSTQRKWFALPKAAKELLGRTR